jgi:transcription antitermination factor NusB
MKETGSQPGGQEPPAARKATRAREIALQALYQYDLASKAGRPGLEAAELEPFIAEASGQASVRAHARKLLDGVLSRLDQLDRRLAAAIEHWKFERLAAVDRCILRLALFELLELPEVPPKVAINEAIELAKKFSTAQSGAFVNGILDRIYQELVEEFSGRSSPAPSGSSPALGPGAAKETR